MLEEELLITQVASGGVFDILAFFLTHHIAMVVSFFFVMFFELLNRAFFFGRPVFWPISGRQAMVFSVLCFNTG